MLNGHYRDQTIGSGTSAWQLSEDVRAGKISLQAFLEAEASNARSAGHCMTMGTASTMASMVEALGIALPTNAAIPAVDSRRYVLAHMAGRRAVEMVHQDLRISKVLTRQAFENAIRVNGAIGGSTNAVIHLLAIAGRIGVDLSLDDWDKLGQNVPCLVNLMPSGKYLMEDFYYAGGLPAVMKELGNLLHLDHLTVSGKTVAENIAGVECFNREVIFPIDQPFKPQGGIAVLRGNLAPDGAIIKPSAATPALMKHRGRAVVFENIEHYKERRDDPALDVDETCVLVLKNCGPKGYPGIAEVGNMALPQKVLQKGVRDMVRISDARMSGTAYGTVVLHTAPEAAVGGPLALVRDGDTIELDVGSRRLQLDVAPAELERRRAAWAPPPPAMTSGYQKIYIDHVLQADRGCDLDFLVGKRGAAIPRESH
jgi:dihydroxy-acid dehydratase